MTSRLAWALCLVLLLIGFFAFGLYLDRYPGPYFDEGAYNLSPIRAHDGLSFNFPFAPATPYGTLVWAYHAPFFPHMQVVTFRLLGVSLFACRIPQFLAAFLGVLLISGTLIRYQCPWSAVLLALFWLGDRSLQEDLYGRMDGIALLFVAAAFVAFTRWLSKADGLVLFVTGLLAGMALGFHPVTLPFAMGMGVAALLLAPVGARRQILYYGAGLAIPVVGMLAFVAPYFREALQQFRWHGHLAKAGSLASNTRNLIVVLKWSRYWALALAAVTLLFLLPVLIGLLRRYLSPAKRLNPVIFSTTLFAVCGCAALLTVSQLPYYLIYFTVWPVAAVLAIVETKALPFHKLALAALALLVVAWLPSAAWNAMRFREARMFYSMLDPAVFIGKVRAVVPAGAPFEVSPEYFILVRPLGHDLVHYARAKASDLPAADWLVLDGNDIERMGGPQTPGLAGRAVAYSGQLYPRTAYGGFMTVFAPVGVAVSGSSGSAR